MCEQIIIWRDDFENIPLETHFVEKLDTHETIFTSSGVVLMESRGNFHLGRFIVFKDEIVFRLDSGVRLSTQLIKKVGIPGIIVEL